MIARNQIAEIEAISKVSQVDIAYSQSNVQSFAVPRFRYFVNFCAVLQGVRVCRSQKSAQNDENSTGGGSGTAEAKEVKSGKFDMRDPNMWAGL